VAARRLRSYETHEVELSPSLRALISPDRVILFDRARGATVLTLREAQALAGAVGTTDKIDLTKRGSG
jgi:hypothetical protein